MTCSFIRSAAFLANSTWSAVNDAAVGFLAWSTPNTITAGSGLGAMAGSGLGAMADAGFGWAEADLVCGLACVFAFDDGMGISFGSFESEGACDEAPFLTTHVDGGAGGRVSVSILGIGLLQSGGRSRGCSTAATYRSIIIPSSGRSSAP